MIFRVAPHRPVVGLELDVDVGAVEIDRLVEVARPFQRIAHLRAAQRQHVVQRVGGVLRHPHGAELREVGVHLGRRLSAGRHLEHHAHAVDRDLFAGLLDLAGRHDQPGGAGRGGLAKTAVDAALRVARQQGAVHVDRAAAHRVAGDHVLADRVFGEVLRREDLHLAGLDVGLVHDAAHAAVVVDVRMAVDHRDHRPLPRCWVTSSYAAFAVSAEISGSNTIQPVSPWTKVMLERS